MCYIWSWMKNLCLPTTNFQGDLLVSERVVIEMHIYPEFWGGILIFSGFSRPNDAMFTCPTPGKTNIAPVPKRISKVTSFSKSFSGWCAILVWEGGIIWISVDLKTHRSLVIGHLKTKGNSLIFTVINTWLHGGILKIDSLVTQVTKTWNPRS